MPTLLKIKTLNTQKKIIGFPYAGGFGSFLNKYSSLINENYDLFSVEYPGRTNNNNLDFNQICFEIYRQITLNFKKDDELILWGFSMGGYVAYKVALLLECFANIPIKKIILVSVTSEERLFSSLKNDWLSKIMKEQLGTEFDPTFSEYIRQLMLKDKVILESMSLQYSCLTKTPIIIMNGIHDNHCHVESTPVFWENKTALTCEYMLYNGRHIPSVLELYAITKLVF